MEMRPRNEIEMKAKRWGKFLRFYHRSPSPFTRKKLANKKKFYEFRFPVAAHHISSFEMFRFFQPNPLSFPISFSGEKNKKLFPFRPIIYCYI